MIMTNYEWLKKYQWYGYLTAKNYLLAMMINNSIESNVEIPSIEIIISIIELLFKELIFNHKFS